MKGKIDLKRFCKVFLVLDILVAALLVGAIIYSSVQPRNVRDELARELGATEHMSEEERETMLQLATAEAARHVTMHSEVTITEGEIPLYLSNAEENACAVSVEIYELDSGEMIGESGLLESGWRLERLPLKIQMDKGEYYCLVRCSFYTMEGNVFLGKTGKHMLLTVN